VFSLPMCYHLAVSPLSPTCLLVTFKESRSYFASTVSVGFSRCMIQFLHCVFLHHHLRTAADHSFRNTDLDDLRASKDELILRYPFLFTILGLSRLYLENKAENWKNLTGSRAVVLSLFYLADQQFFVEQSCTCLTSCSPDGSPKVE
jgi:hypothetical protein